MSSFEITKCVTREGSIVNGGTAPDAVDRYGTIRYSIQFETCALVDIYGNIGCIPFIPPGGDCAFDMSIFGSAIAPGAWEMQIGTNETTAPHEGTIAAGFLSAAAAPLSSYMPINTVGYATGVISGTGTWTLRGGPDTVAGVTSDGNGLLIASGANTHTGNIAMQAGTNMQLGLDCTNTQTWAKGSLTIGANATMTQYASMPTTTLVAQNLNNAGTYNLIGCGTCGVGGLYSTIGVTNTGTINLDDVYWRNSGIWSGVGTVNVKDGATLGLSSQPPAANTVININGCGWKNSACVEQGALHLISPITNTNIKIKVQTAACIKIASGTNNTFSGILSGSAPLNVSSFGTPKPNGIVHFANTGNTYFGQMTVDGVSVNASYGNSLQYANIVLANSARLNTAGNTSQTIGSIASTDPTTYWQSGDPTTNTIKANGVTTYAGKLLWTGGQYAANWFLDGGAENVLTMTSTGNSGHIYPRNGSKLILQGGTFNPGQVRVSGGSTVSAGTSTTALANYLSIDATSALDVYASGATTGKIGAGSLGLGLTAGWKVNLKDPLPAGTHVIMTNAGAAVTVLPTIGENLSGRTVTGFAWNNAVNPKTLSVTLA